MPPSEDATTAPSEPNPQTAPPPAAAGGAAQSPPEPPAAPEEPKPPKARDFAAIAREQQKIRHQERALKEQQRGHEVQRQQERAEITKLQAEFKELQTQLSRAKEDPLNWAAEQGLSPEKAIRGFVEQTAPERIVASVQKQLEETRKDIAERFKQLDEREKAHASAITKQREDSSIATFVQTVTRDTAAHPHLTALYDEKEIAQQTREIHEWAKSNGHAYTYAEVSSFLEGRAKTRYDEFQRRAQRIGAGPQSEPVEPQRTTAAVGQRARPGPETRTLTNKGASQRASAPRKMSPEELDEWAIQELKRATAADRARR